MKRSLMIVALVLAGMPAMAQDAADCAATQTRYETEFKTALIKAIGTLDKKERCEIGREAMTVLDKLAETADRCPAQTAGAAPDNATGLLAMKLVRDGESVQDMVARRKAAFERACGK